jgi:hypothetical protein
MARFRPDPTAELPPRPPRGRAAHGSWTPRKVLAELRPLRDRGIILADMRVRTWDGGLYVAAKRQFGSWNKTLEALGLDPREIKHLDHLRRGGYDRERVIAEILALRDQGVDLSRAGIRETHRALYDGAHAHFRAWSRALKAAGLDARAIDGARRKAAGARSRRWTETRVLAALRDRQAAGIPMHGQALRADGLEPLLDAARRRFGTYDDALRAIGLEPARVRGRRDFARDPDEIIRLLRQRFDQGLDCCSSAVREDDPGLQSSAKAYFGSHDAALEAAGLDPAHIKRYVSVQAKRGHMFENMCHALFALVRPSWRRWHSFPCGEEEARPDAYHPASGLWIDYKLTAWGDSATTTAVKYGPHARAVRLIVLEGTRPPIGNVTFENVFRYATAPCASPRKRNAIIAEMRELLAETLHVRRSMYQRWGARWTPELVRERIAALPAHRRNSRVISVEEPGFYEAAKGLFGSWRQALDAAGLDAREIYLRDEPRTPDDVIAYIAAHLATPGAFTGTTLDATLEGRRIHRACVDHFGGVQRALIACGHDPEALGLKPLKLGVEGWMRRLREHRAADGDLAPGAMEGNTRSRAIYRALRQQHPRGYRGALRELGLDPEDVLRRPGPTRRTR